MSASFIRLLCAPPAVTRPDNEDLRDYAELIRKIRREARASGQRTAIARKRCANPECPLPGRVFTPRHGEAPSVFRARRFCSQSCGSVVSNRARSSAPAPLGPRYCARPACRTLLVRRPGEAHKKFAARSYCSRDCQWTAQRGKPKTRRSPESN